VIDLAIDERGMICSLKKAAADDSRNRAVIFPEKSLMMLDRRLNRGMGTPSYPGLVFSYRG